MCGITGIFSFKSRNQVNIERIVQSCAAIEKRGPDESGIWQEGGVAVGHRRLSILDTSSNGAQPMTDPSGRYTIVFNGEIFNFHELRTKFFPGKNDWRSSSDTEVLLHLFIKEGANCLKYLSGFFALAIFDRQERNLFLARDRFGKKPLLYYANGDFFAFASELKSLLQYEIPRKLDYTSLLHYLQLNYVPQPFSMLQGIRKLKPGHYITIGETIGAEQPFYTLGTNGVGESKLSYEDASDTLVQLMDASVQKRMIADVPLGAFLSGGIDSSVIVALASRYTQQLNTFSIGYKDNSFFDETIYANLVAKKYKTNHTVFSLSNDDFLEHVDSVLDYIDEPFADSSAIPVYILSHHTRKHVTVALSGDGGDEVFAGYNKHQAEWRMRQKSLINKLVIAGEPLWKMLPKSRNGKFSNLVRQLDRFAQGGKLDEKERYWRWAGFQSKEESCALLSDESRKYIDQGLYERQKAQILSHISGGSRIEDVLLTDMNLVLLSDMLVKVDLMSMANSLEVRSPFLDHEIVDFAFTLPTSYKVDAKMKKRIVQDAFRKFLPEELYNRPKKGFEIPLLDWFRRDLKSRITNEWLEDAFIKEQNIFDVNSIKALKNRLFSNNPGDVHATIWALIVFQNWWRKYLA